MIPFEFASRTRVVCGEGSLGQLGELASALGFRRTLLVADRGLMAAGHVERTTRLLSQSGIEVVPFHGFSLNPDTRDVDSGKRFAAEQRIDSIVALGGGSSMDCAKGINFLVSNGGQMKDYWGYGLAAKPMLPMIGIPTTTGTGSEAQSYALISDAETKTKMACGDPKAAFRIAILDPALVVSQPREVLATAGYDAISHAVETFVTTRRNPTSERLSREAWRFLSGNYERALSQPKDLEALGAMQLGAYLAGAAIENSMLGATHACANPLTARYGTVHGAAIALLLAHVVRWNESVVGDRYAQLARMAGVGGSGSDLAQRLEQFAAGAGLATRLRAAGIPKQDLATLAQDAAVQWTGKFNPRPFDAQGAREVYEWAY